MLVIVDCYLDDDHCEHGGVDDTGDALAPNDAMLFVAEYAGLVAGSRWTTEEA